jgi:hypothetical protein
MCSEFPRPDDGACWYRSRIGRLPRTYVRCKQDRALAPAIQTLMTSEGDAVTPGNRFKVVDLDTSHSPFLSQPRTPASILDN